MRFVCSDQSEKAISLSVSRRRLQKSFYIKGIVYPKMKILTLMSFQTRKTFVHLRNTNYGIFDEIRELSDPAYTAMELLYSKPRKIVRTLLK